MRLRLALWAVLGASLIFGAAGVSGAFDRVPPSPTPPPPSCGPIPLGAPARKAQPIRPCPPPPLPPTD